MSGSSRLFYSAVLSRLATPKRDLAAVETAPSHFRIPSLNRIIASGHTSTPNTIFTSHVPLTPFLSAFSDDVCLYVILPCVTMAPKHKDGDVVFAFSGKWVSWIHTVVAYCTRLYMTLSSQANRKCSCISKCFNCWCLAALPQNCRERILWLS